jgi:hypothetical protein
MDLMIKEENIEVLIDITITHQGTKLRDIVYLNISNNSLVVWAKDVGCEAYKFCLLAREM